MSSRDCDKLMVIMMMIIIFRQLKYIWKITESVGILVHATLFFSLCSSLEKWFLEPYNSPVSNFPLWLYIYSHFCHTFSLSQCCPPLFFYDSYFITDLNTIKKYFTVFNSQFAMPVMKIKWFVVSSLNYFSVLFSILGWPVT